MRRMLCVSLCLFAITAQAGNDEFDLTVSGGAGPIVFDNARQLQTQILFNAALAFNIESNWGVEALVAGGSPTRKDLGRDADMFLFLIDAAYHFTQHNDWQPFLTFGTGFSYFDPNGTVSSMNVKGDESNAAVNLNAGVGLQYFISDSLAFRTDIRDIFTPDHGHNDIYFSFGMSYSFHLKKYKLTQEAIQAQEH